MQPNNQDIFRPFIVSDPSGFGNRAYVSRMRNYKYPVIGQTTDHAGVIWDVRDVRTTRHGFDLLFGNIGESYASNVVGLPRLIATRELFNFWETNRFKGHGFLFDLPAGRTTLKRLRRKLGFNFDNDYEDYWESLLPDLAAMRPRDFAAKHGMKSNLAFGRRHKMLGPRAARPQGWWRTPETIALLQSRRTFREIGETLGISISHAKRLRTQAEIEELLRAA